MNRKVKFARLHQGIHVPVIGAIGDVLPPSGKTLEALSLTMTSEGLIIQFTSKGTQVELLVPAAGVAVAQLEPVPAVVKPIKVA